MIVSKIARLREERRLKIDNLKDKLEEVKTDMKYSNDYKIEVMGELNRELETVRHEYEMEILELIAKGKRETKQALDKAEFSDLKAGEDTKLLIKEMRNKDLSDDLIIKHTSEEGVRYNDSRLYEEAEQQVEDVLSTAPAYIRALKHLKINGHEALNEQYKDATMNATERRLTDTLNQIEQQANAYEVDKMSESNPLKAALTEHYTNQPNE